MPTRRCDKAQGLQAVPEMEAAARALPGQHFHLYLVAYGAFRFAQFSSCAELWYHLTVTKCAGLQ